MCHSLNISQAFSPTTQTPARSFTLAALDHTKHHFKWKLKMAFTISTLRLNLDIKPQHRFIVVYQKIGLRQPKIVQIYTFVLMLEIIYENLMHILLTKFCD